MIQDKILLVSKKYDFHTNDCINSLVHIFHKIKLLKLKELLMSSPVNLYESIKDSYVNDVNKIGRITLDLKSHCSWDSLVQDMDKKGSTDIIYYQELQFRQNMKNKLCFCLQPHFL